MPPRLALRPIALPVLALAAAALACGSGSTDSYVRKASWAPEPSADDYARLDRALVVPPDRAVLRVDLVLTEGSAAATAAALRAEVDRLLGAVTPACAARQLDQQPPRQVESDAWRAAAEVRVDVDLSGAADLAERAGRLEACLGALDPLLTWEDGRSLSKTGEVLVARSAPVLVVDAPEAHLPALLARESQRLAAVAGAPGLHPQDLRCTPTGRVTQGAARLSGVELALDMQCDVVRGRDPGQAAAALP